MNENNTPYSIKEFANTEHIAKWQYVAVAYWCDDAWPICAGDNEDTVTAAADRYLQKYPNRYDKRGMFINGEGAEGYLLYEIPIIEQ